MRSVVDDGSGYVGIRPAQQPLDRSVRREDEATAGARDGQGKRRVGDMDMGEIQRSAVRRRWPHSPGPNGETGVADRGGEAPDDEAV